MNMDLKKTFYRYFLYFIGILSDFLAITAEKLPGFKWKLFLFKFLYRNIFGVLVWTMGYGIFQVEGGPLDAAWGRGGVIAWILSKDVVLAVQYKVYIVKRVISLVDTVQYS